MPLTYPNWAGRTWTIDMIKGTPDADIGDQVSFAYLPPTTTPEQFKIRGITSQLSLSHGSWKGAECKGSTNKYEVTGKTDTGASFTIVCTDVPDGSGGLTYKLTCSFAPDPPVSLKQGDQVGTTCWTAGDGHPH